MGLSDRIAPGEARLFFEQDHLDEALFAVGSGRAALHSSRSPAKTSPNEDAAGLVSIGQDSAILAVADGMGGAPAGRQASSIAIHNLVRSVQDATEQGGELRDGVLNAFEAANREVLALGVGAATTLTVVMIEAGSVRSFHAGDSFMLVTGQRGKIKMETIPHSPTGYGVASGLLDEEDALHHEERHFISNVIGSEDMRIEIGPTLGLAKRDTIVLASDGLSDNLTVSEIVASVRKGRVQKAAAAMAEEARRRMTTPGGELPSKPDDLTFFVFRGV